MTGLLGRILGRIKTELDSIELEASRVDCEIIQSRAERQHLLNVNNALLVKLQNMLGKDATNEART